MTGDPVDQGTATRNGGTDDIAVDGFDSLVDVFLLCGVITGGNPANTPSAPTGHGTWEQIGVSEQVANFWGFTLWGCISLGATNTQVVVANSTSSTMGCGVASIPGVDVSGSVANALTQHKPANGYGTSATVTFNSSPTTTTVHFWGTQNNRTLTDDNTALVSSLVFNYNGKTFADGYAAAGDQTPTATISSATFWGVRAVELKDAATGTTVILAGQEITSEQGAITVIGEADVSLTGQEITSEQGALIVSFPALEVLTGQELTSEQGVLAVTGAALIALAGQEIASEQGSITVTGAANVALVGQELTSEQGSITVDVGGTIVTLTGQEITSEQGTITATGAASISLNGQEITSEQGVITVDVGGIVVALTGQEITSEQGVLIITGAATIALTGQELLSEQGVITVSIGESTPVIVFTAVKPQRIYSAVKPQRIYDAAKLLNIL